MAIINVTADTFEKEVLSQEKTVLLDFWSPTCPPCRMLAPVLEELDGEIADKVVICKVDVSLEKDLAKKHKVMSIPTLMVIEKGEIVKTDVGYKDKAELMAFLGL